MKMIPFAPPTSSDKLNQVACRISSSDISHLNGLHFPEAAEWTAMDAVAEAIEHRLSNDYEVRITHNADDYAYHVHHQGSHYSDCLSDEVRQWIDLATCAGKAEPIEFTIIIPEDGESLQLAS